MSRAIGLGLQKKGVKNMSLYRLFLPYEVTLVIESEEDLFVLMDTDKFVDVMILATGKRTKIRISSIHRIDKI